MYTSAYFDTFDKALAIGSLSIICMLMVCIFFVVREIMK